MPKMHGENLKYTFNFFLLVVVRVKIAIQILKQSRNKPIFAPLGVECKMPEIFMACGSVFDNFSKFNDRINSIGMHKGQADIHIRYCICLYCLIFVYI